MYGSCTYNTLKFNSTCVRQPIIPEPTGGGIRLRQRRRKVLIKQFFDISGEKLFFNKQLFDLICFVLLFEKYEIPLNAQILYQLQTDFALDGLKQLPVNLQKDLIGFKRFINSESFDIKAFKQILNKNEQDLFAEKLFDITFNKTLKGEKLIYSKQTQEIYAEKDIKYILDLLDLLDVDE